MVRVVHDSQIAQAMSDLRVFGTTACGRAKVDTHRFTVDLVNAHRFSVDRSLVHTYRFSAEPSCGR